MLEKTKKTFLTDYQQLTPKPYNYLTLIIELKIDNWVIML